MLRPRNRVDRWRGLRAVGRIGLALVGGGVFAFLAWQPQQTPDATAPKTDADRSAAKDRLSAADSHSIASPRTSAAALEAIRDRRSSPGMLGVAAIEPKGRPEAAQVADMAAVDGSSKKERTRIATIAEGSGRPNPLASPRGPP